MTPEVPAHYTAVVPASGSGTKIMWADELGKTTGHFDESFYNKVVKGNYEPDTSYSYCLSNYVFTDNDIQTASLSKNFRIIDMNGGNEFAFFAPETSSKGKDPSSKKAAKNRIDDAYNAKKALRDEHSKIALALAGVRG